MKLSKAASQYSACRPRATHSIIAFMPKRNPRRLIASLVIAIVSALVWYMQAQPNHTSGNTAVLGVQQPGYYHVTHVADGDTIDVSMNGTSQPIRLIGVDTPESVKPNSPVQCYGHEASDFTRRNLDGKNVRLEADPMGDNRDKYNRLLRYVYLQDGTLWNQKLIDAGYGFAYLNFPFGKHDDFAASQASAQASKLGIWLACTPYQESNGRWQSNDLK